MWPKALLVWRKNKKEWTPLVSTPLEAPALWTRLGRLCVAPLAGAPPAAGRGPRPALWYHLSQNGSTMLDLEFFNTTIHCGKIYMCVFVIVCVYSILMSIK